MATLKAEYLGELRTQAIHVESNTTIITDAPVDNNGKGEAFSPTDLCASALATCAMTIIGIYAQSHGMTVEGTKMDIVKVMASDPRRIAKIEITFTMPANNYSDMAKASIEKAAHTCPVSQSLNSDLEQVFNFIWL